jgi:hypothetical protein
MGPFKLDPDANIAWTSHRATVRVAPKRLVGVLGPPLPNDGYKVSGLYAFVDEAGNVFTVYDYKATTLYYGEDGDRGPPTPEEFWADSEPVTLSVGGRDAGDVNQFLQWLFQQLAT